MPLLPVPFTWSHLNGAPRVAVTRWFQQAPVATVKIASRVRRYTTTIIIISTTLLLREHFWFSLRPTIWFCSIFILGKEEEDAMQQICHHGLDLESSRNSIYSNHSLTQGCIGHGFASFPQHNIVLLCLCHLLVFSIHSI